MSLRSPQVKWVSAEEAISHIRNGDRVFVGSLCAEPRFLVRALAASPVEDVEIIQLKSGGETNALVAKGRSRFRLRTFNVGRGRNEPFTPPSEETPLFHSEIPAFFRSRRIPVDVALIQVSEPDRFGQVNLGISVDIARAAVESARTVIAQVNPRMPRTLGASFIPLDHVQHFVEGEDELLEIGELSLTDTDRTISRYCSDLVEDEAVLQIGFAGISRGLIEFIRDRKNLGIHSEMVTDSIIDLIEAGVVTNSTKEMYRGKSIATFCVGTRRLYDFVDGNPLLELHPSDLALSPRLIASNKKMTAVNLALQVDLRGQVRQGGLGWTLYEGGGGEQDFMRGAALSPGGRSIVCLRSTDGEGNSNIVVDFPPHASIITNRGDVRFVVTEYGIAYLGNKSVRERAMALIEIAHPDHRERLMEQARELKYVYSDQTYFRTVSAETRMRIRMKKKFKDGLEGYVRALRSTDESMLRDLFYNMSESSVYFRYFTPRRSMPHKNLQEYLNLPEERGISVVVTVGPRESRKMVAEGRYVKAEDDPFADVALMVDEDYHRYGIGAFLLGYLVELAKERGIPGFRADILPSNDPALKIVHRLPFVIQSRFQDNAMSIRFRFDELKADSERR
jgi:acyl-CoA hydrolase